MAHPAFARVDHRPWPVPGGSWIMRQIWHDLMFLHWPVGPDVLRSRIPAGLELDLFDGQAWVAITPFWMSGVTLRGVPPIPFLSRFSELNVRTYVTRNGKGGVWFFSLDATNPLAVRAARIGYHLPYRDADIQLDRDGEQVRYRLTRSSGDRFEADYQPIGTIEEAPPGSLAHWLTERYCLYARAGNRSLYRAEIHHLPWPLQPARVEIHTSNLLARHGISIEGPPAHVRYSRQLEVVIWPPEWLARP
jgi:uncharacterized protein YqjF (DUF2071 family)